MKFLLDWVCSITDSSCLVANGRANSAEEQKPRKSSSCSFYVNLNCEGLCPKKLRRFTDKVQYDSR